MNAAIKRSADLTLDPGPDAPALARAFLAARCRMWSVTHLLEAASLVVSELVTNAVRHAGTRIRLRLSLADTALDIAVFDTGSGMPRLVPPEQRSLGGRGLVMVEKLAEAWGVTAEPGGKSVWCRISLRSESL